MLFFILAFVLAMAYADTLKLSPNKEVYIFTAEWCDTYCDRWLDWFTVLENKYTSVTFHRLDIDKDKEEAERFNLTSGIYSNYKDHYLEVPTCVWVEGSEVHLFNGARNLPGIEKWLKNALEGQYHPVFTTSNIHDMGIWDNKQAASITVLSEKEPYFGPLLSEIPSLGYSWGVVNDTEKPVIFIRSITNNVSMAFDYRWDSIFKKILPPIIPIWIATTPIGLEAIKFLSVRDVEIHHDGPLEKWWDDVSIDFPYTAFLQYRANETDLQQLPKVIVRSRSVVYEYDSVGRDADVWFRSIWKGDIVPTFRKSAEPEECHAQFVDITGNTLWPWVKKHDILLYTYGQHGSECEPIFQSVYGKNESFVLARMNFDENDHELFPNIAKPHFIYLFKNTKLTRVLNCREDVDIHGLVQRYNL